MAFCPGACVPCASLLGNHAAARNHMGLPHQRMLCCSRRHALVKLLVRSEAPMERAAPNPTCKASDVAVARAAGNVGKHASERVAGGQDEACEAGDTAG